MINGLFKSLENYGHARATNDMSTQSSTDFEWSVKLVSGWNFCVGIASQLKRENIFINTNDQNAILYRSYEGHKPDIKVGSYIIHRDVTKHKTGDVIRFRFQPQSKKLLIDLVRKNTPKLRKL